MRTGTATPASTYPSRSDDASVSASRLCVPGRDRLGEDRGVDAQVRVRGPEEAVQVDVLDDAHRRRREPARGGETRDERLVRATVLLAGVLLHDQVHIGPWPVQQSIERVRDVEPPIRRPVGSGQHDHPVVRPDAQLGAEGRGVRVRGRFGEVQAWRAADPDLVVPIDAGLRPARHAPTRRRRTSGPAGPGCRVARGGRSRCGRDRSSRAGSPRPARPRPGPRSASPGGGTRRPGARPPVEGDGAARGCS